MTMQSSRRCLAAIGVVLVVGCAAHPSPELVAARAVTVLETIQIAQRAIIAAEAAGAIDEDTAAAALGRILEAVRLSRNLRPVLEGWAELTDAQARADRLEQARAVVYTLSQVLAAVVLPGGQMAPVREALLSANDLFLRIEELRGGQ